MQSASAKFITQLRAIRKRLGLTQEALAERVGISYKVYQHIEAGRRSNPRLSTLEKLAKGLGVEVRDFFPPEE